MKEQNLWKMAVAVFIISLAFVLADGGMSAKANDRDKERWFGSGDRDNRKSFDYNDRDRENSFFFATDSKNLIVYANTVIGGGGLEPPIDIPCVLANRFPPGQKVVWRIRVLDLALNPMDDTQLEEVFVRLPDGREFPAHFGGHPPDDPSTAENESIDYFWSASWVIPLDEMTGSFEYRVFAITDGHRIGTFKDFNIGESVLQVIMP